LRLPGGQKFVVEREPEKEKEKEKEKDKLKALFPPLGGGNWLLVEPKLKDRPHADREQVEQVLLALSTLSAKKWVRRAGPKDDLSEFGLKAPAVVAVVTLKKEGDKGEAKTYTYHFGNEVTKDKDKDKGNVYALVAGGLDLKDIVFLAPPEPVKMMK